MAPGPLPKAKFFFEILLGLALGGSRTTLMATGGGSTTPNRSLGVAP
jgi:hypothetical protein